jgi:serine/threonine protein kinase
MAPENGESGQGVWEPDEVLSDRYRVVHEQRHSSTGYIYKVVDVFRDVPHLVLCPSPRMLADPNSLEWFVQFCRNALSVAHHPNLLACRRMDYEGKVPYLVMDYLEGCYWDQAIERGLLTELSDMLNIAIQVARGLEWLHENGRVHGNFKPANVLVSEKPYVGEVLKYGETYAHTRAYAAPEQLSPERELTPATDIWCWAVSVLHMFTGMVNWSLGPRAPKALARYLRNGPAVPGMALMPVPVVRLLEQCFAADPEDRPASTAGITEQLEDIYYDVTNAAYEGPPTDETYESEHLVDEDAGSHRRAEHNEDGHKRPEAPPPRRRFSPRRQSNRSRSRRRPDEKS